MNEFIEFNGDIFNVPSIIKITKLEIRDSYTFQYNYYIKIVQDVEKNTNESYKYTTVEAREKDFKRLIKMLCIEEYVDEDLS